MKKTLIAAALLAATGFAQAATVSYSDTEINSLLQSAGNKTDWTSAFTLAKFDGSLGTLNSVSLTLSGMVDSIFNITNTGPTNRMGTGNSSAGIETSIAGLAINPLGTGVQMVNAGQSVSIGPIHGVDSLTIAGIMADWSGAGDKSIAVTAFGNSNVQGSGNFASQIETWANATLTVTYDYTVPVVTQVPEPASLALFAAGLIGLGAARRRKA